MKSRTQSNLESLQEFIAEGAYHSCLLLAYVGLTLMAMLVLPFVLLGRAVEGNGKVYKHNRCNRGK